jgi:hypothetical protein
VKVVMAAKRRNLRAIVAWGAALGFGILGVLAWRVVDWRIAGIDDSNRIESSTSPTTKTRVEGTAAPTAVPAPAAERTAERIATRARDLRKLPSTWIEGTVVMFAGEDRVTIDGSDLGEDKSQAPSPELVDLDGSFVPDFVDGVLDDSPVDAERIPEDDPRRVRVVRGRFRFDSHGATSMFVESLVLGGRVADADSYVEFGPKGPASIVASWNDDVLLHVVDDESKAELRDISIVTSSSNWELHPGLFFRSDVVRDQLASPFRVSRKNPPCRIPAGRPVWIGAPGHAWQRRVLDFEAGPSQKIELETGASLVVDVQDDEERAAGRPLHRLPRLVLRDPGGRSPAALRIRREIEESESRESGQFSTIVRYGLDAPSLDRAPRSREDWPVLDVPLFPGPLEFDGLVSGDFVATVEIGDGSGPRRVLDRANVTLVGGETADLELAIPPGSIPEPVRVGGTLFIPQGWREDHYIQVELEPIGLLGGTSNDHVRGVSLEWLSPESKRTGWYRWRTGPILPATYRCSVARAGFETTIEVGREGRDDVVLVLPEPAILVVRVVEEATGEPVELPSLEWIEVPAEPSADATGVVASTPVPSSQWKWIAPRSLEWDGARRAHVGAVAIGSGWLDFDRSAFPPTEGAEPADPTSRHNARHFLVHSGTNDLEIRVRRRCGIDFLLDVERLSTTHHVSDIAVEWTAIATGRHDRATITRLRSFEIDVASLTSSGESEIFNRWPYRIVLPEPGRYRIQFPDWPSIAPFEVDVLEHEFVKYTVTK